MEEDQQQSKITIPHPDKTEFIDVSKEENQFVLVCGFCANHDNKRSVVEINFIDMAMYYKCSKCHKINILDFCLMKPKPYPSIIARRG